MRGVCVFFCASVCFWSKRLVGARRTEPTWAKEWYPLETAADVMSPPGVGSKMQDYDHWDALVIGEWPPGRSGPPFPSLPLPVVLFALSISLSQFLSSCHVQVLGEFHFSFPVEGLFSMYLEVCMPLKVARPLGSLLVEISVPSAAGCIYT